jgi:hypothetical protein
LIYCSGVICVGDDRRSILKIIRLYIEHQATELIKDDGIAEVAYPPFLRVLFGQAFLKIRERPPLPPASPSQIALGHWPC